MLRSRASRDPLKVVRKLDAFPKVPEEYQTSSKIGGTRKQQKFLLHDVFRKLFFVEMFTHKRVVNHIISSLL